MSHRGDRLPDPWAVAAVIAEREQADRDAWDEAFAMLAEPVGWMAPISEYEPAQAELLAALNAFHMVNISSIDNWSSPSIRAMRDALRAAGGVR